MSTRYYIAALVATALLASGVGDIYAQKVVVPVSAGDLNTYRGNDPTRGSHYVLQLTIPAEVTAREIQVAFLDLRANVTARPESIWVSEFNPSVPEDSFYVYLDEEPTFEVYALGSAYEGDLATADFLGQSVSREGVLPGADRRIHIDVTEIVRYYIANPSKNFGLVLGSINGRRDGIFEIQENAFGGGVVGQLTIYSSPKYKRRGQ